MSGPLLTVGLDGRELARIERGELPCEKAPAAPIGPRAELVFTDPAGTTHVHGLGDAAGWAHFSIRVHGALAVQADCVLTESETVDPAVAPDRGIRFQPFFLAGSSVDPATLVGQGLFARGLHYPGRVTQGWVRLSGACDLCRRSFLFQSFHAGFGDAGYFYSGSGRYTLIVDAGIAGAPPAQGKPDQAALTALEQRLPPAPDGSRYGYLNPFRCPHCGAPYIDFARHPGLREGEYYGNYLIGVPPIRYDPSLLHQNRPGELPGR